MRNIAATDSENGRRFAVSTLFLLLLFAAAAFPKINLGELSGGKNLNIVPEDIVLACFVWFFLPLSLKRSSFRNILLVYLFAATLSTLSGLLLGWVQPVRAGLYLGREYVYLLLFITVSRAAQTPGSARFALKIFMVLAAINCLYVIYQFASGRIGFTPDISISNRVLYYGIRSLSEYAPTAVANFFSYILAVSFGVIIFAQRSKFRFAGICIFCCSLLGLLGTFSRAAVFGGVASLLACTLAIIAGRTRAREKIRAAGVLATVALSVSALLFLFINMEKTRDAVRRLTEVGTIYDAETNFRFMPAGIGEYFQFVAENIRRERYEEIHAPILELASISPLIGLGKSVTGLEVEGIETDSEAHNYFLRLYAEMGIMGLLIFGFLLFHCLHVSFRALSKDAPTTVNVYALAVLGSVVFLGVSSLAQDAFLNSKTATMFWVVLGLFDGSVQCRKRSLSLSPAGMKPGT
jgi:hypothetical protein